MAHSEVLGTHIASPLGMTKSGLLSWFAHSTGVPLASLNVLGALVLGCGSDAETASEAGLAQSAPAATCSSSSLSSTTAPAFEALNPDNWQGIQALLTKVNRSHSGRLLIQYALEHHVTFHCQLLESAAYDRLTNRIVIPPDEIVRAQRSNIDAYQIIAVAHELTHAVSFNEDARYDGTAEEYVAYIVGGKVFLEQPEQQGAPITFKAVTATVVDVAGPWEGPSGIVRGYALRNACDVVNVDRVAAARTVATEINNAVRVLPSDWPAAMGTDYDRVVKNALDLDEDLRQKCPQAP